VVILGNPGKKSQRNALIVNLESGIKMKSELLKIRLNEFSQQLASLLLLKPKKAKIKSLTKKELLLQKKSENHQHKLKNRKRTTVFYFFTNNNKEGIILKRKYSKKITNKRLCFNLLNQRSRGFKRGIIHAFSFSEWKNKLKKFEGCCPFCGKRVGIDNLSLDHILPLSLAPTGFVYTIKDVQPLCMSCNSKKSNKVFFK